MSDIFKQFLRSRVGRAFYKDGPPHWTEGKRYPRPAPSMGAAKRLRDDLVGILSTLGPNAAELRKILARCSVLSPCGSGACPRCGRAIQRWFVAEVSSLPGLADGQWSIISIVPDFGRFPLNEATGETLRRFRGNLEAILDRVRVDRTIGGIDVSINEHSAREFETHGQLQAWLLAPSSQLTVEVHRLLSSFLRKTPTNIRPLHIAPFDGRLPGIAYALKWTFSRRVTLPREVDHQGMTIRRRNTRHRALRVQQAPLLARMLHDGGFEARVVLRGWKIVSPVKHEHQRN